MDKQNVRHSSGNHNKCAAEGCVNDTASPRAKYCAQHPWGRGAKASMPDRVIEAHGYVRLYCPSHPLTVRRIKSGSREYEHRVVFYDAYGEGPFTCPGCRRQIGWHNMHIDHINGVRHDNRVENLEATCNVCNGKRATANIRRSSRERCRTVTFDGRTMSVAEWSEVTGIMRETIDRRLRRGEPLAMALNPAPRAKGRPKRAA